MDAPSAVLEARAARLLGWTPRTWRAVCGGYTPAARYVVSDGRKRVFLKVATSALTADHLRGEIAAYRAVRGPFMPQVMGWDDDPGAPMLAIEDLSDARWPPPWDGKAVDAVLDAVSAMHATPAVLPTFEERHGGGHGLGWAMVAANPGPFLSLGLASAEWLAYALAPLTAAEAACATSGAALAHWDLRSDNMCLADRGVMFIDWSGACRGNPVLDLGTWLPSLAFEGGPLPDDLLPDEPAVAAWVCGFFAARAGEPDIPDAPFVRRVQREQLSTALPWVVRALGLSQP
jgi:hypothetical protein